MVFIIWLCFGFFISNGEGAKILAMLGTDMNSHFKALTGILEALAPYHEITFYVPSKFNYEFGNITTMDTPKFDINGDISKNSPLKDPCQVDDYNIFTKYVLHDNKNMYETIYSSNSIRDLMNQQGVYDLLILNAYGAQYFIPLAHHLKLKIIQVSPSFVDIWLSEAIKNQELWDTNLAFTISDNPNSLYGRTKRYLKNVYLWYRYHSIYISTIDRAASKYFPVGTPSTTEVMNQRTELVFVNTQTAMGLPKPNSPMVIEAGGSHISPARPLPTDLQDFMNSATDGVIYFSLGTVVKGESMNKDIINAMLRTFGKMKQKVLWKIQDNLENVPSNVKFSRWFPQQDILRHYNTKVFITQGGMLSMTEASTFGVPTLIMPVLFDQKTMAQKAEEIGYGTILHFCEFTEQKFYDSLMKLLENTSYKATAKQVSHILLKERGTLKEKINFWTEFVLKYKENSILRTTKKQTWLEAMPADIFICLTSIAIFLTISLTYIISNLSPIITKRSFKIKEQ